MLDKEMILTVANHLKEHSQMPLIKRVSIFIENIKSGFFDAKEKSELKIINDLSENVDKLFKLFNENEDYISSLLESRKLLTQNSLKINEKIEELEKRFTYNYDQWKSVFYREEIYDNSIKDLNRTVECQRNEININFKEINKLKNEICDLKTIIGKIVGVNKWLNAK